MSKMDHGWPQAVIILSSPAEKRRSGEIRKLANGS
jgi:hypothetical protein